MSYNHNDFSYTVFGKDQFAIRESLGFTGGNFSTDGNYVVGDTGSSVPCEHCNENLPKPIYVPVELFPNWPHLSQDEARTLIGFKASAKGASDGWTLPEDDEE